MSIQHTVVLLPSLGTSSAQTAAQKAALEDVVPVLVPDISFSETAPVILEGPALRVLTAISTARSDEVVLIGHGWGSMVALQIAATHGELVAALMLSTNARLETIVVRSIFHGILSILPARVVQQLGGRPADVAALLDQVRPVDFKPLAERVQAPAFVMVGERDVANRGPSDVLARSLPLGNLRVVPKADPDWQVQQPQVVAQLLVEFLSNSSGQPQ
jgi:pimeloyl-ACP methyl ester carboxylesterase